MIPIARPDIGQEEITAVTEVLQSGMIAQGRKVKELEDRWAEMVGVKHAIAVGNGTLALMGIFAGIGLGPGDEVITVSHTFAATANAILSTGATPVFVDIEPDTYLIDARRIEQAITPRTRAICPVHLFGLVADMDMIRAIADRHGLAVVEDAGPADGATFRGRRVGSFGHGAARLYPTDDVATGDGGLVTTDDDRLASWIRAYRHGGPDDRGRITTIARGSSPARTQGYPLVRPPDANCALLVIRAARRGGVFVACLAAISWLRATIDAPSLWMIRMFSRCSGARAASFASSAK